MGSFPLASRSQSQRDCSLSAKSRTQLNFGRSEAEFVRDCHHLCGRRIRREIAIIESRSLAHQRNPLIEENETLTDPPTLDPFLSLSVVKRRGVKWANGSQNTREKHVFH